ncbi:MAG: ROK family glucokinase [Candidatus Nanopelagicales bacterium]
MSLAIGVDLGGTKIAAGVVDEAGVIIAEERRPTPTESSEAVLAAMADAIAALRAAHDVSAVGIGAPGFVNAQRDVLLFTPNLPMADVALASRLRALTGLPVVVENDANAAAWAEFRFGGGAEVQDMVLLTIGTGLGGGIVSGGQLLRGSFGVAAEVGHIEMVHGGHRCGCGLDGCWEQYASGSALVRVARRLARKRRDEATQLLALGYGTPEGVKGKHITRAARAGDPVALAAFEEVGIMLGRGMAILAAVLDPAMFVIGGGVSDAGELLVAPARRAFEDHLTARAHRPLAEVALATLGNDAGIAGAADLARN